MKKKLNQANQQSSEPTIRLRSVVPEIGYVGHFFPSKTCLDQSYCRGGLFHIPLLNWQNVAQKSS